MVNKKLKKYFQRQSVEKIIGMFLFYVRQYLRVVPCTGQIIFRIYSKCRFRQLKSNNK